MKILRTNSLDRNFKKLCLQLDNELNQRYDKEQAIYDKHNIIEDNKTVIVGYLHDIPIASGCFKEIDHISVEIKRMYVVPAQRRKGFSTNILCALEKWAKELGYSIARLETGKGQPEAIGLYEKCGYKVTENYRPYIGFENSICMQKEILRSEEVIK